MNRNFFLSQPVSVILYVSRIRKLLQLVQIEGSLGHYRKTGMAFALDLPALDSPSIISLIRWKELCHALSRTAMAKSNELDYIAAQADQMCSVEAKYEEYFLQISGEITPLRNNHSMSWRPNYGALILEIDRNGLSQIALSLLAEEKARILAKPSFPYYSPLLSIQNLPHEP